MAEVNDVVASAEVTKGEPAGSQDEVKDVVKEGEVKPAEEVLPEPVKTYTQEDLDRITAKVKKNARYQARKETEAFYKGRDSRPEVERQVVEDKAPERDDYTDYESYLEAKAIHVASRAANEARIEAEHSSRTKRESEERRKVFEDFREKTQEKYPDLEDRMEEISEIVMPPGMGQAIAESPLGPDILDYFTKNPKECERISALSPYSALRELGRLETKLESKPEPKKQASKAPVPLKPGGGVSPPDETQSDSDTTEEWIRKEEARWRKKAGIK